VVCLPHRRSGEAIFSEAGISEVDELDALLVQAVADSGVAEGIHFGEAFLEEAGVGGGDVGDVAGVDHDFDEAFGEVVDEALPD